MRLLSKNEIENIIQRGRELSDEEVTSILDEFEKNQPKLYQGIYGSLSDSVAKENEDMSNLFVDLCFDIILVYKESFGAAPFDTKSNEWFTNKVDLLDTELRCLDKDLPISDNVRKRLNDRFVERSVKGGIQLNSLKYIGDILSHPSYDRYLCTWEGLCMH